MRSTRLTTKAALIQNASAADAEQCLAVLTLAFSNDPLCRWAWPDPQQYLEAFPRFAQACGGAAFDLGTAHFDEGFCGVALWLPPGAMPDEPSLTRVLEDTLADERKPAMFSMFEEMDAYHPHAPHWQLPLIGVNPTHQGRGIGSSLQRHILQRCDREQVWAHLEATSPRSVPFYERHGFEVLGTIRVADSPPVFPMVRQPR